MGGLAICNPAFYQWAENAKTRQNGKRTETPGFRRGGQTIRSHQGRPQRGPRSLLSVADVSAWFACVGGLQPPIVPGGY